MRRSVRPTTGRPDLGTSTSSLRVRCPLGLLLLLPTSPPTITHLPHTRDECRICSLGGFSARKVQLSFTRKHTRHRRQLPIGSVCLFDCLLYRSFGPDLRRGSVGREYAVPVQATCTTSRQGSFGDRTARSAAWTTSTATDRLGLAGTGCCLLVGRVV